MFVYMIQHKTNSSLIYIGSCVDFETRISQHKTKCYNPKSNSYNSKKSQIIRENGGWDAFKIQIIDAVISADKDILLQCEQYYIDKFKSIKSMNTFNAIKDIENFKAKQAQYRKSNADKQNAYQAQYRKSNADKQKAYQAQYRKSNADKQKAYLKNWRSYLKVVKELRSIEI